MRPKANNNRGGGYRVAITRLEHRMNGHRVVPSNDPPTFVQRPWNSYTFNRSAAATQDGDFVNVEVDDLFTQIISNCGLDTTATLEIKVLRGYVWCATNGPTFTSPVLVAQFYEGSVSSAGTTAVRSDQRDVGTLSRPAKAGYVWPINEQRNVFIKGGTSVPIIGATALEAGCLITVRVHLLWRATGA